MLSESEGCAVLHRVFAARGYTIAENVPFDEGGVRFTADGWDAGARVGYEYLTRLAGDHAELAPGVLAELGRRIAVGELFFFVVDEVAVASEEELAAAANGFLDEVARRQRSPGDLRS
jgi:hypothetical protein